MKKYFLFSFMAMISLFLPTACSDDDNDEVFEGSDAIYGSWVCTEAKVVSLDLNGMSLPDAVASMIKEQLESDLIGDTMILNESNVKLDGKVLIFKGSDIKWQILSLTGSRMDIRYDTTSSYSGMTFKMKVEATYQKK